MATNEPEDSRVVRIQTKRGVAYLIAADATCLELALVRALLNGPCERASVVVDEVEHTMVEPAPMDVPYKLTAYEPPKNYYDWLWREPTDYPGLQRCCRGPITRRFTYKLSPAITRRNNCRHDRRINKRKTFIKCLKRKY